MGIVRAAIPGAMRRGSAAFRSADVGSADLLSRPGELPGRAHPLEDAMRAVYNTYQEIPAFGLRCLGVLPVVPGQYVRELSIDGMVRTGSVLRGMIAPMYLSVTAFYVPFRLCQTDWDQVLSGDAVPAGGNVVPFVATMEAGTVDRSTLPRRAFKLVYNQFFGDQLVGTAGGAWYDDPMDDTNIPERRTRASEQFLASAVLTNQYEQDTFLAAVSGATASIPLGDLARAQSDNRNRMRQALVGEKYVDQMRLFGVDLDWRVQMAPEFLGVKTVKLDPFTVNLQAAADAGQPGGSYWAGQFNMSVGKKRFAEHGLVLVMATLRHASFFAAPTMPARDPHITRALRRDGIYRPIRAEEPPVAVDNAVHGGGAVDYYVPARNVYLAGEDMVGSVGSPTNLWLPFMGSASPSASLYPQSGLTWVFVSGAAVCSRIVVDGSTPAGR